MQSEVLGNMISTHAFNQAVGQIKNVDSHRQQGQHHQTLGCNHQTYIGIIPRKYVSFSTSKFPSICVKLSGYAQNGTNTVARSTGPSRPMALKIGHTQPMQFFLVLLLCVAYNLSSLALFFSDLIQLTRLNFSEVPCSGLIISSRQPFDIVFATCSYLPTSPIFSSIVILHLTYLHV